jgi:hypothetical protein
MILWGSRLGNSPPAVICWRRPKRMGGWWSAIDHSLAGVSHDARRASVTGWAGGINAYAAPTEGVFRCRGGIYLARVGGTCILYPVGRG